MRKLTASLDDAALSGRTAAEDLQSIRLTALMLVALCFPIYTLLAWKFDALGVFEQYNVLFDADPSARLGCFAQGWGGDGRSIAHPNLCNLINPPIRVAAAALQALGIGGADVARQLALLVAPAAAAAAVVLMFLLALRAAGSRPLAIAETPAWVNDYVRSDMTSTLGGFPAAVVDSYAAPTPGVKENTLKDGARYSLQFTLADPSPEPASLLPHLAQALVAALILAGSVAGLRRAWRGDALARAALLGAVGILLFNGILHAGWGSAYFLYSQHWLAAGIVLVALTGRGLPGRFRHALLLLCTATMLLSAAANYDAVMHMIGTLANSSASAS
jgi:hypothetical protein